LSSPKEKIRQSGLYLGFFICFRVRRISALPRVQSSG
jgi:hypothetical protein